jgi:hypothetical protein
MNAAVFRQAHFNFRAFADLHDALDIIRFIEQGMP